jgi:hypothetical protein
MRGVEIIETLVGIIESQAKISRLQLIEYIAHTYHNRGSIQSYYPATQHRGIGLSVLIPPESEQK